MYVRDVSVCDPNQFWAARAVPVLRLRLPLSQAPVPGRPTQPRGLTKTQPGQRQDSNPPHSSSFYHLYQCASDSASMSPSHNGGNKKEIERAV